MITSIVPGHASVEDRRGVGEGARGDVPVSVQAVWEPAVGRVDPVELLNRPGFGGGIDPTEGWSHVSTEEVSA
jgi:hypothetical protein